MSVTVPVIAQPDAEAWIWANIGHLHGVTSWTYAATLGWPGWVFAHYFQVDCRSTTKRAARDLAEQVRQIMYALPELDWPEGTVSYVQAAEGPFWMPDDDGAPRYVARYEVRVHPRRRAAAGTVPVDAAPGTVGRNSTS